MAFCNMKGHILEYKRPSFARQKTAFCNALSVNALRRRFSDAFRKAVFGPADGRMSSMYAPYQALTDVV